MKVTVNDRLSGDDVADPVIVKLDPSAAVFRALGDTVDWVDDAPIDPPVTAVALIDSAAVIVPVDVLAEKDVTVMANGRRSTMR